MSEEIYGPFGEILELRSLLDEDGGSAIEFADETVLAETLRRYLDLPGNRESLRRIALEGGLGVSGRPSDYELVSMLAQRIATGAISIEHAPGAESRWDVRGTTPASSSGGAQPADTDRDEPPAPEPKIKDWRIECGHHVTKGRDLLERGTSIDLVPDVGTVKDRLLIHWRDDWQGSMPPALTVRTPGRPESQARQSGGGGGYTTYGLEAEYLGDIDIFNIVSPLFWRAYLEKTTYTVQPGPTSIPINVYNPRQFKFEFKLPPMAGLRDGSKYEASGSKEVKALAQRGEIRKTLTTEDAYWSPSSLKLETTRTSTNPSPDFKPHESEQKLADVITLTRDDALVPDLDYLKLVGSLIKYADTLRGIVEMVKDYAPKVGWYIDWNLQLMQGGMAVEWYWKEHHDRRVFQYIDFNIALTVFHLTFEIGIGISACSFKLQLYAQLEGELGVEAGAKRDSPDGAPGFKLPGIKGKITGALGARAEAGYFFKFEAKGETAIESELGIGINQRNSMVTFDARARWTGIKARVTYSAGFLGVSYNKTESWQPVGKSPWWGLSWPQEQEYVPPTLSRDRIASVVESVLYRGWNVRVFDGDDQVDNSVVAGLIADRIERDRAFDKTQKMVDALANGIRQDLDLIGERSWGRDYLTLSDLRQYLAGGAHGRSIATRLSAGASPTRQLIAANS